MIVHPLLAEDLLQEGGGGRGVLGVGRPQEDTAWREGGRALLGQDVRHDGPQSGGRLLCSLVEQLPEETLLIKTPDNVHHQAGIVLGVIAERALAAAAHWHKVLIKAQVLSLDQCP